MINRFKEFYNLAKSKSGSGTAAELGWVFSGQLFNVVLSFVILKLLSKMGTTDYGIYALVLTIASLLSLIIYGPAVQGFIRFYFNYLAQGLSGIYLNLANKFLFATGLIFAGTTLLLFLISFFLETEFSPLFFLFAGMFIAAGRIGEFYNSFLNLIRKRKENSLLQGGEKFTTALVLLLLIIAGRLNLVNVFAALSIITILFFIFKIRVFNKNIAPSQIPSAGEAESKRKNMISEIRLYVFPFIIWGISGWLQLNGEKWIIAGLLSTSAVGIYAVMMSLVTAFIIVPANILSEFSTPIIFQNYADKGTADKGYLYININMLLMLFVTLAAFLITVFTGKEIIIIISSPDYAIYWYLLPLLCLGTGLFYTGQALTSLGLALNLPKKYLLPKILTGVFSVVLNFVLISVFGIAGAAYTLSLIHI